MIISQNYHQTPWGNPVTLQVNLVRLVNLVQTFCLTLTEKDNNNKKDALADWQAIDLMAPKVAKGKDPFGNFSSQGWEISEYLGKVLGIFHDIFLLLGFPWDFLRFWI